ncbi:MAG: 50S ribosomal protein L11 methyltransferase [Candidatus Omnitrophica bacterium]|nr:50S ribosomal protein L11 methyltransferase [Candidatus Omnitrophota bacterium]
MLRRSSVLNHEVLKSGLSRARPRVREKVPKIVYRLRFESARPQELALVRAVLFNLGFREGDLAGSCVKDVNTIELFGEHPGRINRLEKLFKRLDLKGVKFRKQKLAPEDWLTLWKSRWKPARLTKKIDVVPVWCRRQYKLKTGRDVIYMDTLLSFGTGLHETTRLLAQFIEDKKGGFRSFFDIGTGTGILALVAIKNGAGDVLGVDIGGLSVQAARDNMKTNRLPFRVLRADIQKYASKKSFDFVAANLITADLIAHARKIIGFVKRGGFLGVSGISLDNLSALRKAFSTLPLKCIKVSKGKEWTALLYQKRM